MNDLDDASLQAAVKKAEELAAIAPPNPERMPAARAAGVSRDPRSMTSRPRTRRAPEMVPHVKDDRSMRPSKQSWWPQDCSSGRTAASTASPIRPAFRLSPLRRFAADHDHPHGRTDPVPVGRDSRPRGSARSTVRSSAAAAIEKCLRWRKPEKLDPGNYTVVLEPTAAGDLVRLMADGLLGARLAKRAAPFSASAAAGRCVGEKLFPEFVTLSAATRSIRGSRRCPGRGDLLPTRRDDLDRQRCGQRICPTTATGQRRPASSRPRRGRRLGSAEAGGGGSLIMEGGDATLDQLIASVERGLLITHFWYIRGVNPQTLQMTGLTRDGVFLIENGKITDAGDELPLPRKPGAPAAEYEEGRSGDAGPRTGRRHDDRAGSGRADFPLPSISEAI